jgi:hypothetical protein
MAALLSLKVLPLLRCVVEWVNVPASFFYQSTELIVVNLSIALGVQIFEAIEGILLRHLNPQLVKAAEEFDEIDGAIVIHVKKAEGVCEFLELLVDDRPNNLKISS